MAARTVGRPEFLLFAALVGCAARPVARRVLAPEGDAAQDDAQTASTPSGVSIPPTHTHVLGLAARLAATRPDAAYAPSLVGGRGTVRLGADDVAAVVLGREPFGGYELYEVVAVAPDRVALLWYYCRGQALAWFYAEDTLGQVADRTPIAGTCTSEPEAVRLEVDFPAAHFAEPPAVHAYKIEGPSLRYDGLSPGFVAFEGGEYTLLPFARVDCGACGGLGWQELHTLLVDRATERVGLGLIYLFPAGAGRDVQLSYGLMLPTGERLTAALVFPDSRWSQEHGAGAERSQRSRSRFKNPAGGSSRSPTRGPRW